MNTGADRAWLRLARRAWSPWAVVIGVAAVVLAHHALGDSTLAEDEAHYWEWSRRLDWSYATKGPGVAWAIRASTALLGETELGVRMPSLLALAMGMIGVVRLTRERVRDPAAPFVAALLWIGAPALTIAGFFATIDAPYIACWAWACVFATRAACDDAPRAWIGFGLLIALGFLFKYTMLLLVPGAACALLLVDRPARHARWLALGLLVSLIGLVPVAVWNAGHDWATVRHLLEHLGLGDGESPGAGPDSSRPWSPLWALEFVAVQAGVCGATLALGLLGVLRWRAETTTRMLAALALPIYLFYLGVALVTPTEGNWAIAGVVPLIPLASRLVLEGVRRGERSTRVLWGAALVMGIASLVLVPLAPYLSTRRIIGPLIPAARFHGMREHAAHAARRLETLRTRTGGDPFVMSAHSGRSSQLAFYLEGEPVVYCAGEILGGRMTQYDLWPETDLRSPSTHARLVGRDALLMGGSAERWGAIFERVEPIGPLESEPADDRSSYVGFGYTGVLPNDETPGPETPDPETPDPEMHGAERAP